MFRHARRVEEILLHNDQAIFKISTVRAQGAVAYISETRPQLTQEAERQSAAIQASLQRIQADPHCVDLVEGWQNGNVRQMLNFATSVSKVLSKESDATSVKGVVFSEIVRRGASVQLVDVYDPRHVPTKHRLPFVFLRIRLLSYLRRNDGVKRLSEIRNAFYNHFGVAKSAVDEALDGLSSKRLANGGLVRIARALGEPGDSPHVILLPAGRVFITDIVYSCEFLAWAYEQSTNMPGITSIGRDGIRVDPRLQKLERAAVLVDIKLLPAFVAEHPYIVNRGRFRPADRPRLDSYRTLFGYDSGKWFIQSLADSLASYARHRGLESPVQRAVCAKIARMVANLDSIVQKH